MTATLARPPLDPLIDAPLVGPRVLSLVGDESGCSLWRVWQPTAYLRTHGYPCDWAFVRDPLLAHVPFGAYQAIVVCRLSWTLSREGTATRAEAWLRRTRREGRRVFFEADDDFFTPFVVEQQAGRIRAEKTRRQLEADRRAALWLLERVDGVTVSTQYLASTARRYTAAPVQVVPNAVDAEWFTRTQAEVRRALPSDVVVIGWAGGNRPDADLAQMAQAWGRVAARYPRVRFAVVGHQPPVIGEHVPEDRVIRVPWLDAVDYPKGMVGIDIGCCPLEATPFNRGKSPIKCWEYALGGAAVVASPTVYRHCVTPFETGMLCESAAEWDAALSLLVEQEDTRRTLAAALKRQVLERWTLRRHYWRWPAAWQRLWEASR